MISYWQAIVIGVLQGVTELFPVSSLGHSVLVPAWLGWHGLVGAQSADESFYLAFLVTLHVATALALLVFFRRDWDRIIRGFFRTLRTRHIETPDERIAWLLVIATIPAGLTGLLLEHTLRTVFAKPLAAAVFLTLNGVLLAVGERLRRRAHVRALAATAPQHDQSVPSMSSVQSVQSVQSDGSQLPEQHEQHEPGRRLDTLAPREAGLIGVAQIGALFAGVSRSGITMVAGLLRGLDHEDAARFSFLLATPIILAAGIYKMPDLIGPLGNGVRGQSLVGAAVAGVTAYFAVRFLTRFFQTRTLWPFAIYCLAFGALSIVRFA